MWAVNTKRKSKRKENNNSKISIFWTRFEAYRAAKEKEGKNVEDSKSLYRDFKKEQELKDIEDHDQ